MKRLTAIITCIIALCLIGTMGSDLHAQVRDSRLGAPITLHLTSTLVSGNSVKIGYKIPYDGYIEFNLFDQDGERIWFTSYVREKGDYFQALRRDKLESSTVYKFDFLYKGKRYSGSFNNS